MRLTKRVIWQKWLSPALMGLAAVLLLLSPAIWNGFPHVYSDTGAYLATAFEGKVPLGRPTGYGLFLRYSSLGGQLWLSLVVQALLVVVLLWQSLKTVLKDKWLRLAFPVAVLVAVLGTGLQWYAGQLMPDVLTGCLVLVFFLLWKGERQKWYAKLGLSALAFVLCICHYSHMALLFAFSGLVLMMGSKALFRRQRPWQEWQSLPWTLVPAMLSVLFFYTVNYSNGFGWKMTRSSHVFTMAKLSESGLLKEYLDITCEEESWSLCAYKDSLPSSAAAFIWNEDSPFKKTGYWADSRPGYDSLLSDFFSRPYFLRKYAMDGLHSAWEQLFALSVGEGLTPYNESSSPYKFFERAMPEKVPAYLASVQFERELDFAWEERILKLVMLLSLLGVAALVILKGRSLSPGAWAMLLVCLMGYVLNAAITGALANVYSRLQARVAWLLPLAMLVLLIDGLQTRSKQKPS